MRNTLGMLSFLCWMLVLLNEVASLLVAPLWRDNEFPLWSALLFGVWMLAEAVMDAAEFVKGEEEG